MSLLQKASIITTPTAYAEDYLYSIKPARSFGSELVTNGNFANGTTNWTANNSTLSVVDNSLKVVSTAGFGNAEQNITVVGGQTYEIKADFIYGGSVEGRLNAYDGSASPVEVGSTSNTNLSFKIKITAGQTNLRIRVVNQSSSTSVYNNWDNVSVKLVTDADFDFDRNSTGTRVNEDYLIEDVPYNLASYSENLSQWVNVRTTDSLSTISSPQNTTNVYKIIPTTDNATHRLDQVITLDDNNTYTLSFFAKKEEYNCIRAAIGKTSVSGNIVSFNLNTGVKTEAGTVASSSMTLLPNGWYRCSLTTTASTADRVVIGIGNDDTYSFAGDGTSGLYLWGIQIVKGDQPKDYLKTTDRLDIPRIDYTNGEPSILLEPNRTNLFPYSNDYTQSDWTKTNVTITQNAGISPENLNNASKMIASANASFNYIFDVLSGSSSQYTISAFVKADGRNIVWLYTSSVGTNGVIYFDLSDASMQVVAGSAGTPTGTITKMPNGWYRITSTSHTFTLSSGSGIGISDAKGSLATTTDGTNGVLIYGLQIEAGSYATSLIHTSGSAVTRTAEYVRNAGNSDLISNSEGVLYAELARTSDNANYELIAISSGVANYQNIVALGFDANNNEIWYRAKLGNTDLIIVSAGAEVRPQNEFFKIAVKYKSGDTKVYLNGRMIDSSTTTGSTSVAFTTLDLAFYNIYNFNGKLKNVTVFKEALTDLELEKLTGYNNHELYMNYYNRLSYLGLAEEYNVESDINNYIL